MDPDAKTRQRLAFGLVAFSVAGTVIVACLAIGPADHRDGAIQLVFSAVLPLFGTWVGTVLAFYFARENFQAATESALRIQGRDAGRPVTEAMIRADDINAFDIPSNTQPQTVKIEDIRKKMSTQSPPSRRLPIRNKPGAVLYVIHDSTLNGYTDQQGKPPVTLGDLLADPESA